MEKCPICGEKTLSFEPDPQFPKQKEAGFCPCTPQGAVISRPKKSKSRAAKAQEVKSNGDTK